MKRMVSRFAFGMTLLAAVATPLRSVAQDQQAKGKQAPYLVRNLDALGGTASVANGITNRGWVTGQANLQGDQVGHAFLWRKRSGMTDLGTLGGPNSGVFWPVKDDRGLIAGVSEISTIDPLNENFCGFGTGFICLAFLWQDGQMTPLATLGGNNGYATGVNNRGQAVGYAETGTQDPSCIAPQVFDWEGVIWGPKQGEIHVLLPLAGDSVGAGIAINDEGQVVGGSGICAPVSGTISLHAVLWQDGSPIDLGSLGGAVNNAGTGINNKHQVIGFSDLAGDIIEHAFLWSEETGIQDLGALPGDFSSSAFGINNQGQVVGQSCDQSGNCRAVLWQNGTITDLNTLIAPGFSLYLVYGGDINDRAEITGNAYDQTSGATVAFLAVPTHQEGGSLMPGAQARDKVILPESVREQLRQRQGFGRSRGNLALVGK